MMKSAITNQISDVCKAKREHNLHVLVFGCEQHQILLSLPVLYCMSIHTQLKVVYHALRITYHMMHMMYDVRYMLYDGNYNR